MSGSTNQYETLYGVSLLDDLHNYFPAILYDSARFQTVPQLLHYLQTCIRNRFDLFSFGQRNYLAGSLEPAPAAATPNLGLNSQQGQTRSLRPEPRISVEILQEDLGLENQALSLLNLMNLLSGVPSLPRAPRQPNSFMEPVIVRPTAEQIESGSTRAFPLEDTTCAICQDSIPVNQMARRLNVCGHTFHISCIDQWFGRDVRCPTCRHDIRETAAQPSQAEQEEEEEEEEV